MVLIESADTLALVSLLIFAWAIVMSLVVPYIMVTIYYFFHDRKVRRYRRMLLDALIRDYESIDERVARRIKWEREHGL